MARKSSEDIRSMNAGVVGRLLEAPVQDLADGSYALRVLEARGRATGEPRRTPLGVVQVAGVGYLVSPDPQRDWVRNLDRHPGCTLLAGSRSWPHRAVRASGGAAVTAIATYLRAVTTPWALQAFPVAPDSSPGEIQRKLDAMAVFRLDPP